MKKYIFQILLLLILVCILFSCNVNKGVIRGEISEINGREVKVSTHRFLIKDSAPMPLLNKVYTFQATKDSSKVNCIKLK